MRTFLAVLTLTTALAAPASAQDDPRVGVLRRTLTAPAASVRYQAVQTIAKLSEPALLRQLLPLLAQRFDDKMPEIRLAAVSVVTRMPLPETLPVLARATSHAVLRIRLLAVQALGRTGDTSSLTVLEQVATRDKAPAVRNAAMKAISAILVRVDLERQGG